MTRKSWKNSNSPKEIMELIKKTKTIDKFKVLTYFGIYQKDLGMLEKLLKSGYYTPEEIAEKYSRSYLPWSYAPARKLVLAFSDLAWQKSDNLLKVLSINAGGASDDYESFLIKLKYFEQYNHEIYEQLLQTSKGQVYILNTLARDVEKNKNQIFNMLIKHSNLLDGFDLMEYRELFTDEEFEIIQQERKKNWKHDTEPQLIMYKATPENKWEILEYFANKNEVIFNRIVSEYVTRTKKTIKKIYSRNEILEHYSSIDLDILPVCLKNYVLTLEKDIVNEKELKRQKQEERIEVREKKLLSWSDEYSLTVFLFKLGSITPKSKKEYEKVMKKYLVENLSITSFCIKYKISDVKGFKKMLEKFSAENPQYAEQIKSKSNIQRAQYVDKVKEIIKSICVRDESVGSIMKHSKIFPLKELQMAASSLFPDKDYCESLTIKVVEYYYSRLVSHAYSIEPKNLENMLTNDEIRFIIGNEEYNAIISGKKSEIKKIFLKRISFLNSTQYAFIRKKVNSQIPNLIKAIAKYDSKFNKKEYLKMTTFMFAEGGKQVEVTKEMVDIAYQYAYSKNIYPSDAVMRSLIKDVLNGKIKNIWEAEQDKKNRNNELEFVNKIANIDEYFEVMDNYYNKNKQ
ncbi:MAG: hypothetical protein ACI4L7_04050 [Christensenellales bacterium]